MIRRVSDAFNVDLGDAAEAAYQTVSNQIASTEKDVESFLGSAAKFSKITKTDMTTAVNLLSGTLNAFGKDVSETEDVAAKFFNTIKLGRTRAEELAQGMGTINPIANKLGISMEELNAAVATLTIQGLKTDKVVTQIRGAMQAFLKPTVLMKKAMAELGYETGEQVFEANNLQEAIRLLISTTDGSAAAVAKLFPRIRGLTGVLGLATDEVNHFTTSMKEQKDILGEIYDKAYDLVITTDAEKVTKSMNKLNNAFIDVFGQQFLAGAAQGLGVLEGLVTNETEHIKKAYTERGKEHSDLIQKETQRQKDALEERSKQLAKYAAVARKEFLAAASAAENANNTIAASTQWAIDSMMGPVDAAISAITKATAEVDKTLAKATQHQADANRDIQDFLFQRSIKAVKDDPILQISLLRKRAADENIKSQKLAAKSNFDAAAAAHSRFVALQKQAIGVADSNKMTKQSAELVQFLAIRNDRYIKSVEKGKVVTKDGAKGLAEAGREIIKYKADLDTLIEKMQETQKAASDKDLTPKDQVKLAEQAAQAAGNYLDKYADGIEKFAKSTDPLVRKLFQDIEARDMTVEIKTIMTLPSNIQEIFGMIQAAGQEFFNKVPVEIKLFAAEHELATDTPKQVDEVNRQYLKTLGEQIDIQSTAVTAASDLDNELLNLKSTIASLQEVTTGEALIEFFEALSKGPARAIKEIADKPQQFEDLETVLSSIQKGIKEGFETGQVQVLTKQLENLTDRGFLSRDAMKGLYDSIIKIQSLQEAKKAGLGVGQQELQISNMLKSGKLTEEQVQKAYELKMAHQNVGVTVDTNKAKLDAAKASQDALTQSTKENAQAVMDQPTKVQAIDQAANQLKSTQSGITSEVGNTNSGIQQMTSQFQTAEAAARGVANAVSGIGQGQVVNNPFAEFNAHGGRVGYFASGGQGTDTINAMLSKGEHVTNARSSRRFFSQLQAMNAGQNPVFRSEGGDTYNTTVGDINVSGGGNPQVAAREVMKAIRREERRGSGR
jgi:TP901 family phage tail tape measure protein